jgi:hypothetical protein
MMNLGCDMTGQAPEVNVPFKQRTGKKNLWIVDFVEEWELVGKKLTVFT